MVLLAKFMRIGIVVMISEWPTLDLSLSLFKTIWVEGAVHRRELLATMENILPARIATPKQMEKKDVSIEERRHCSVEEEKRAKKQLAVSQSR